MYEPNIFHKNHFTDQSQTLLNVCVESNSVSKDFSFTFVCSTSTPINSAIAELFSKQAIKNTFNKPNPILSLESLLKARKFELFFAELEKIDWTKHHPKVFIYFIRLALELEAIFLAQKLSSCGKKLYPENSELQKFAHILEKPTLTSKNRQSDIDLQANSRWIMENRQVYKGQWVALKDGSLLDTSKSLKTLASKFPQHNNIYFTKVY